MSLIFLMLVGSECTLPLASARRRPKSIQHVPFPRGAIGVVVLAKAWALCQVFSSS